MFNLPQVTGIIGRMGAGKTLLASAIAWALRHDYEIWANYDLKFRDGDITPEDVMKFSKEINENNNINRLFVIDEVHLFADSRATQTHHNILMTYFFTQTRKQNIKVLWTSQVMRQVEIRVRENTDEIYIPEFYPDFDRMLVHHYQFGWADSNLHFADTIELANLKHLFNKYDTKQLMGNRVLEQLKARIETRREQEGYYSEMQGGE